MSWAEVFKINKNMKRAINEQIRDLKCTPIRVITSTGTYVPEKTGLYKVICVGAGSEGVEYFRTSGSTTATYYVSNGSAGGVAIKEIKLVAGTSYNVTVSTTASFGNIMSATGGVTAWYNHWTGTTTSSAGGTASGGDYNYTGQKGCEANTYGAQIYISSSSSNFNVWTPNGNGSFVNGSSIGVVLTDICQRDCLLGDKTTVWYGTGILGYGAGAPSWIETSKTYAQMSSDKVIIAQAQPAAVIIIPLEMEE